MSRSAWKIMIRVIRRRMNAGEELEEILSSYPKLTKTEKKELSDTLKNE